MSVLRIPWLVAGGCHLETTRFQQDHVNASFHNSIPTNNILNRLALPSKVHAISVLERRSPAHTNRLRSPYPPLLGPQYERRPAVAYSGGTAGRSLQPAHS